MSSRVDPSQLASTKLSDDFERFRSMVERQLRRRPGSGASLEVIEDWGKEFVEYFVSICLRRSFNAILIVLRRRGYSPGTNMLRASRRRLMPFAIRLGHSWTTLVKIHGSDGRIPSI